MNKQLGFVCGLFLLALIGCGQIDWSQLVATATSAVSETPPPAPTVALINTDIPSNILTPMSCELTEVPFLIQCVAPSCNVRQGVGEATGTEEIVYSVPEGTLLSAFGICECVQCSPFSRWYWLGTDINNGYLWAVADEHIWQTGDDN